MVRGSSQSLTAPVVFAALTEAVVDGALDNAGGGVAPETLASASRLNCSTGPIRRHLIDLLATGHVEGRHGRCPENHDLTTEFDGPLVTVEFPVYIDCIYQNGRYDGHSVARHGYAADAPFIDTPRQARSHYRKRFGIESSYRLSEKTTISTTTQDPVRRLLFVVISLLFQNVWRCLHWEYVATPRRGGRRLWKWPFEEFIDMVTRAVWSALAVRRAVPANKPPDDRFER